VPGKTEPDDSQDSSEKRRSSGDGAPAGPPPAKVAAAAAQQIAELIGKPAGSIVSLEPIDDGWLVGVEVLDERRIPSTSDMLALYEVQTDLDGQLVAYRRTRRYSRGSSMDGNGNSG
jgi:hypothetical protein